LGNSVEVLNAESRIETIFGHLNSVSVRVGDRVKAGDVIGYAGSTGRSTGVHLHLVVKNAKTGKLINPRDLLNKKRLSVAKEAPKQNGPRSNSKVNIEKLASNTAAKRRAQDKEKLLATQKQEAQLHIDLAAASQKAEQYRALYQEGAVSRNDMQEKEREVEHLEDQLNRIRRIASI
jgi:multidrug efflux pump subunit AcrA (membrane-fusion protein)